MELLHNLKPGDLFCLNEKHEWDLKFSNVFDEYGFPEFYRTDNISNLETTSSMVCIKYMFRYINGDVVSGNEENGRVVYINVISNKGIGWIAVYENHIKNLSPS